MVQVATFEDDLRGLKADRAFEEGEVILSVPIHSVINENTVLASEFGVALKHLGDLSEDWYLLLFTLVDRHDRESRHASFWKTLPEIITTGLTMPDEALACLEGLPQHQDFVEKRQHVAAAYSDLRPLLDVLLKAYPDSIHPEQLSYDAYLWAVQLWYAYAMQVELAPGDVRQCLVPHACLLNHHSRRPSIRNYGRVEGGRLLFRACRACAAGEQVFLSYGPLPNWHLLLFYGFATDDNPRDEPVCVGDDDSPETSVTAKETRAWLQTRLSLLETAMERAAAAMSTADSPQIFRHLLTCLGADRQSCSAQLAADSCRTRVDGSSDTVLPAT